MQLLSFYATLHARPPEARPKETVVLPGGEVTSLDVRPDELGRGFERTFEDVAEILSQIDRLYFEPDGSFVWVAPVGEPRWQLDGVVYDRDGCVLYVDVKGTCPSIRLDQFLVPFGWPQTPVMFQLTREALFLDEAEFRRFAAAAAPPVDETL